MHADLQLAVRGYLVAEMQTCDRMQPSQAMQPRAQLAPLLTRRSLLALDEAPGHSYTQAFVGEVADGSWQAASGNRITRERVTWSVRCSSGSGNSSVPIRPPHWPREARRVE